jgi:hypothetical protein
MSSEQSTPVVYKQNEPSICIPRTFDNITWNQVKETFEQLFGEDCVDRVDVVKREHENGDKFNRIFVHFKRWDEEHAGIRSRLLAGEEIKIVYDEPWFWKCSMSRVVKPTGQRRTAGERRGPYIADFNAGAGAPPRSQARGANAQARRRVRTALEPTPTEVPVGSGAAEEPHTPPYSPGNGEEAPSEVCG